MKKILGVLTVLTFTMMFSMQAFAHSSLSGSNPNDGEVKTEPVQEITLNFDGKIMEGSFIEITTTNGEAIEVTNFEIGDGYLTGTVAEPLANNDYTVNWSIISADGHPLEGSFSFTVNAPVVTEPSEDEETNEEQSSEQSNSNEENDMANETVEKDDSEEQSNSFIFIVLAIAALVLIVGSVFVLKRKK